MDLPQSDLEAHDAARPRGAQVALGPSDTGGCIRRNGYQHHGVPPDNDQDRYAARLGTLLHLGWSAIIAANGDPDHEADVEIVVPGLSAPGHADDVHWRQRVVNDLKSVSGRAWERWVTYGAPESAWDQVQLYAYGLICAEEAATPQLDTVISVTSWTLALTVFNRESGREARFERPADRVRGEWLANRMVERQEALTASEAPEDLPREGHGPGRGFPCDWCGWMGTCWPPEDGGRSPQAMTIVDDPAAVARVMEDYLTAGRAKSAAERQHGDARAYLTGLPEGVYAGLKLRWTGGQRVLDPEPDVDAMMRTLAMLHIPIPYGPERRSGKRIRVTREATMITSLGRDSGHVAPSGDGVAQP